MTKSTITQADRKAAADMIAGADLRTLNRYEQCVTQAFAAHREAAVAELRAEVERFAQAVIELSDNIEDRDGLSNTTEYTVDAARATLSQKETSHDD